MSQVVSEALDARRWVDLKGDFEDNLWWWMFAVYAHFISEVSPAGAVGTPLLSLLLLAISSEFIGEWTQTHASECMICLMMMLCFNPSQQLSPAQPLARSPLVRSGGESEGNSLRDSLIGKAKTTQEQSKKGINSLLPVGWQVFSLTGEQGSVTHNSNLEDECHCSECPLLPPSFPRLI